MKVYLLLKMVMFHCHFRLLEGTRSVHMCSHVWSFLVSLTYPAETTWGANDRIFSTTAQVIEPKVCRSL